MSDIVIGGCTFRRRDGDWVVDYEEGIYSHVAPITSHMLDELERLRAENDLLRAEWVTGEKAILDVCDGLDADTVERAIEFLLSEHDPNRTIDWKPRADR